MQVVVYLITNKYGRKRTQLMNDNYNSRPATARVPDRIRRLALFSDN